MSMRSRSNYVVEVIIEREVIVQADVVEEIEVEEAQMHKKQKT